jgi:hypothetical protein
VDAGFARLRRHQEWTSARRRSPSVKAGVRLGLFCAALIVPADVFGQENARAKGSNRARAWDVAGSIEVRPDAQILPFPLHLELGHYWTTHLKIDMRVVTARERASDLEMTILPDGRSTAVRAAIGPFGL